MDIANFKNYLYTACKKGEVSKNAIFQLNKLASENGFCKEFFHFDDESFHQESLVFNGPTKQSMDKLKQVKPKISIIVPTWNRSKFLCRCVDSILAQNYENIEIIIINDCSTDNTTDVVKAKYGNNKKIEYIENQTNLGPGGNRQKAYLVASGEYIVFADDDDYYIEPEFFTKALALFIDYPNLSMVCANSIIFDDINKRFDFNPLTFCGTMRKEKFLFGFGSNYRKPNSTFPTIFKKSVLDMADFANMKMMNDTSIYLRAACFGDVCMIKDWVGIYWVHETNISKTLPFKFIIENLNEKNNIYQIACKQFNTTNPNWLLTQQMITIKYYINSEKLSLFKFFKLKLWIKKHGGSIKKMLSKATNKVFIKSRLHKK